MPLQALSFPQRRPAADPMPGASFLPGCTELLATPFCYGRDEEIYGEGEEAEFVYRIVTGAVRICKILGNGRRQIHAFQLPGDTFGFALDGAHRLTAEAIVDTKVVMFRGRQLSQLARANAEAACRLWDMAREQLRHAEDHMVLLGRHSALERVAAFLLDMDRRLGRGGAFELPMTRRDIADHLGLTLETVSRSISDLQKSGLVQRNGARRLQLERSLLQRVVGC